METNNSNSLGNFKYFIGVFMLIILIVGLVSINISQIMAESSDKARTDQPGGRYTLEGLIEKYNLDADEFYAAIKLPKDFVDTGEPIVKYVRAGILSYTNINTYMTPIVAAYRAAQAGGTTTTSGAETPDAETPEAETPEDEAPKSP